MNEEDMELSTIERLLKEKDLKLFYIELLKSGDVQKVINLLERDVNTIETSLEKSTFAK